MKDRSAPIQSLQLSPAENGAAAGPDAALWAPQTESDAEVEQRAKIFKALADPNRVRIAMLLARRGWLSGTEIATGTGMSMGLFAHHWRIMHEAGLIVSRKQGQTRYCALDRAVLRDVVSGLLGEG